ncbi:MAG: hypothetical protein SF066_01110, partial [Thermoanaerobaculia bacterium]|nr:hypothetical protein [Thermoanaerobaculia bacterium]
WIDQPVGRLSQSTRHQVNPSAVVGPASTVPNEPTAASAKMLQDTVPAHERMFVTEVTRTRSPTAIALTGNADAKNKTRKSAAVETTILRIPTFLSANYDGD